MSDELQTPENETVDDQTNSTPNADSSAADAGADVQNLTKQLADAEKRVLMAHADMENYRKRARRDMQEQAKYASLELMNELLESVDNLQRALESNQSESNSDGLAAGVQMVLQQISHTLEKHGCQRIESVGQVFDPNLHQAVQMQPSEAHPANVVSQEFRAGFRLHDRVIRPAQVMVSTGPQ